MTRKNGDWTIKKTKQIFKNDFLKVIEDEVIQPDGKKGTFATVEFTKGSAVLPVDDEENVYLTRQFRYALEREDLEVAAGTIENRTPLETARRETREELGIEAEEWTRFGKIEENTSITKSFINLYLARKLTFKEPEPEATEKIKVVKMALSDAVKKVMDGEITHDLTCILILKTHLFLKDKRFGKSRTAGKS